MQLISVISNIIIRTIVLIRTTLLNENVSMIEIDKMSISSPSHCNRKSSIDHHSNMINPEKYIV